MNDLGSPGFAVNDAVSEEAISVGEAAGTAPRRFSDVLAGAFGPGRRSRFVLRLWLISVGAYMVSALLLFGAVRSGVAAAEPAGLLVLAMLAGVVGFYVWVRVAHENLPSDDVLFAAQAVHAMVCAAAGYAIVGPERACALLMAALTMAFSMFARSTRVQRGVLVLVLVLFGSTMAVMSEVHPDRYPAQVELVHFLALTTFGAAIVILGAQLIRLRSHLQQQKTDLSLALQRIQLLATRDDLTGLMNRRCMQDVMALEHQRCMRSGQPFCLAVLDLDHFKLINDAHGHGTGDAVLRAFAREATTAIRISDVLARWGGEEFLLLMSDTRGPLARQAVERLRERVCALRVPADDRLLQLTVSVGLVEHRAGESLADTIERADRALYAAKAEGRNRVAAR